MVQCAKCPCNVLGSLRRCLFCILIEAIRAEGAVRLQFGGKRLSDPVGTLEVKIGAALSLTGTNAVMAAHVLRGFQLFVARVNNDHGFSNFPAAFALPDGSPIRIKLIIDDDQSKESAVQPIYRQMIDNNTADYYLAPYSSSFTYQACNATNGSAKILMAHNAGTPSIHTDHGFRFVFSTSAMAYTYMNDGLALLRSLGCSTMVAAWDSGMFNQAVCLSAIAHARHLGFRVVGNFSFGPVDLTNHIRAVSALAPDVFIGCGHLTHAINTVVTSRALGFTPKAMMMIEATMNSFIQAVGAPNANYLYAPVAWHENTQEGSTDALFGSAGEFASNFRAMFGVDPTYHSAAGAAAVYALMVAVQQLGRLGSSDEVRNELLQMDIASFYGRLQFATNGTLVSKGCVTQQLQPLTSSSRQDRYTQSAIVHVGVGNGTKPVLYEMPTWEQKELEVLPCDPGYVLDQRNIVNVSCKPCAIGRYRPHSSLACADCGNGYFGDTPGLAQCKVCPIGADCGLAHDKRQGQPLALPGHYKLPRKLLYEECDPPSLCLGENRCKGNNMGVMCKQCKPGYTTSGAVHGGDKRLCGSCPDSAVNAILIFFLLVCYSAYIGIIGYLTLSSSSSIKAMHSIILKKIVNHMQLATTAWSAGDFNGVADFSLISDASQDPIKTFMSLDCILVDYEVRAHEARVLIGLVIVPLVLFVNFLVFLAYLMFQLRAFQNDVNSRPPMHWESNHDETLKKDVNFNGEGADETYEENCSSSDSDTSEKSQTSIGGFKPSLAMRWNKIMDTMTLCLQWTIVWLFILHPIAVKMLLDAITCVELDVMRLKHDLDIECKSSEHELWSWLSTAGLILYGLGIPFFTGLKRHHLMHLTVRKTYGFLYNGFESHWYYFEIVYMLRKVVILLCASIIPVMYVRIMAMLCLALIFLALHIYCNPYDNRDYFVLDKLETTSLLALILTLQLRLFINLRDEIKTTSSFVHSIVSHNLFDWMLGGAAAACHGWFWLLASWSLLRNSLMKLLHLKAECAPEKLTSFQQVMLLMESQMHRIKMKHATHELDISALSRKERRFLYVAICDTMECYINTDHHFHPGRLVTAVRRALALCSKDRAARAHHYLSIMDKSQVSTSWLRTPRRWIAELSHAMNFGKKKPNSVDKKKMTIAELIKHRQVEERHNPQTNEYVCATVEELQNALMLCWPEIIEHSFRFFVVDKPPMELKNVEESKSMIRNPIAPLPEEGKGTLDAKEHEPRAKDKGKKAETLRMSKEDVDKLLAQTETPLSTSNVKLRRRHVELSQEVWLLRAEVAALAEHLRLLESTEAGASPQSLRIDMVGNASDCSNLQAEELHTHDAKTQVVHLAHRLRGLGREKEAVEMTVWAARAVRIGCAWAGTDPLDEVSLDLVEEPVEQNQFTTQTIVESLRKGEGVEELRKMAENCLIQLRLLGVALRHDDLAREGNMMDAIALKVTQGLLSEEDVHRITSEIGADGKIHHIRHNMLIHGGDVKRSRSSIIPGDVELSGLEKRIHTLVEHLQDLNQQSDASIFELLAFRMLEMRQLCRQRLVSLSAPVANDSEHFGWHEMGPVAQQAVKEAEEIAARLRNVGLEEEGESVNALTHELAHGLIMDLGRQ